MKIMEITEKEYFDKKLEVAKSLLPAMVAKKTEEYMQDKRKRTSLLYNCVVISEDLMIEMGFVSKGNLTHPKMEEKGLITEIQSADSEDSEEDVGDQTSFRKLSEMLPPKKK